MLHERLKNTDTMKNPKGQRIENCSYADVAEPASQASAHVR